MTCIKETKIWRHTKSQNITVNKDPSMNRCRVLKRSPFFLQYLMFLQRIWKEKTIND